MIHNSCFLFHHFENHNVISRMKKHLYKYMGMIFTDAVIYMNTLSMAQISIQNQTARYTMKANRGESQCKPVRLLC